MQPSPSARLSSDSADRKASKAVAIALLTVLLLSVAASFAVAEGTEEPTASFLPAEVDSAGDLAPLVANSEPVGLEADTNPAVAEELPHTDLNRTEAEELLKGVFGVDEVEAPADFFAELDIEAFRSDHVAVVAPAKPGAEPGLLFSTLPLRTVDESGEEAPVDLGLETSEGNLEPANSLVPLKIPARLSQGISLPEADVTVELAGSDVDRVASELGNASAFYPNVATDTDLVVVAVPTGFETYTHLRSPEAPTEQRFTVNVPVGADLRKTGQGGAEVVRDGSIVLSVSAPSAIDAEGSDVPVELDVEGSSLVLSVDPDPDTKHPILVDPVFNTNIVDFYNFNGATTPGTSGKDWVGSYSGKQVGYSWGTPDYGMNTRALVGPTAAGSNAWFNYYVPRFWSDVQAELPEPTTYIRDMKLWNLSYKMPDETNTAPQYRPAYPSMQMGLWSTTKTEFASFGERFGYQGAWTDASYVFDLKNPQENTDLKLGGFGIATWASYNTVNRYVNVQQASVEVTDKDSPGFGALGNPSGWMNTAATGKITYVVSEPGLGIHSLKVKQPRAEGGSEVVTTSNSCVGNTASPCPRTAESATRTIIYSPQSMAQGENFVEVTAADPVNHVSSPAFARIKVDHSAPNLSLAGNLTEQGAAGANLREYTLNYTAKDGDDAAAEAMAPAGSAGKGEGQLERPMGVATAPDGSVYAVDRLNNRVVKYDKEGKFALQFGSTGSGDGQFNDPRGIDIAPDGTVWVADLGNDRIQAFSPSGTFLRKAKFSETAAEPYAIACGPGGVLWVSDVGLHRLVKLTTDPLISVAVATGSQAFPTLNFTDLVSPTGVATDKFGNVWVADGGLGKVLEFDSAGKWKFQFGAAGSGDGQIDGIVGIDVSPAGNIAITERNNGRVQIFKPDGSYLRKFGSAGSANNQFSEAGGLSFGPDNTLAVADAGNERIVRWSHADQDPQSGSAKVVVQVDGAVTHAKEPGCTTKNCSITGSWTLDVDDFSGGAHKVEVTATDAVGITQTKTIDIETHGDHTDPTIALSGTMTQQASIGTTKPSYKLKAVATDPGPTEELKSGVASTVIKVDGVVVDSSSPGCPAGGCSITREWTLNSDSYSAGSHTVEVKATDAAGRISTKTLTIDIARDTTPPEVSFVGALYSAPSGWLEQKAVGYAAYATDSGYGVTSVELKIDGVTVSSVSQICSAGGCSKFFGGGATLAMDQYSGGAHPAEFIARDGAGNAHKRTWTINVDPDGHISASEAEDTLEALDTTSPVNTVGDPEVNLNIEGTSGGLTFQPSGSDLIGSGGFSPTTLDGETPGQFTVEVPSAEEFGFCPNEPDTNSSGELSGQEEEELAQTVSCPEPSILGSTGSTVPVTITPITLEGEGQQLSAESSSALSPNAAPGIDLITRPLFDGAMTFAAIRDRAAQESYSWRVNLEDDQTLELIDSRHVAVKYLSGHQAFSISAISAHDAVGTTVPTSLSVAGDVLTLKVDHRSAEFVYPVVGGAGWEGGFQVYEVVMPPPTEQEEPEEPGELEADELDASFFRWSTFGPPQPFALPDEPGPLRRRAYNFNECHWNYSGVKTPDGKPPAPLPPNYAQEVKDNCHGPRAGGLITIDWAVSVSGVYEYRRGSWVQDPDGPTCRKWGPREPALVHCYPTTTGKAFPHLNVIGDFRFAAGVYISPNAQAWCMRINGVLPNFHWEEYPGNKVIEGNYHKYVYPANPGEKCPWNNLDKVF